MNLRSFFRPVHRRLLAIVAAGSLAAAAAWPMLSPVRTVAEPSSGLEQKSGDVDPRILDGTEQRRLDRARDRWRREGVHDYRFRVALHCFCPAKITAPRVIVVRRGRPQHVPSHLREAATVPRLLRIVQDAIDNRVAGLNVHYGSRGVPRSIGVDSRRQIADDEHEYVVDPLWFAPR
jgi:hypothetical protein